MIKLKILKIIVFIMTFLIVFGLLFIIGQLAGGFKSSKSTIPPQITLPEAKDGRIKQINSTQNALYILVKDTNKDKIFILNPQNYAIISTITTN